MASNQTLLLAYYGDDFTGSTDALEFLSRAGMKTALFLEPPSPKTLLRYEGLQAIGVAGMTRALAPTAMEAELRPAFTALRALGAPHVHYKVCSTFDSSPTIGSIGRAIEVGSEVFKAKFVPLLVGAPALGRHCVFGNLFARMGIGSTGEIHRLDRHPSMSRHPTTPADESDLRIHLARQTTKGIGLLDILQFTKSEAEAREVLEKIVADGAEIVLFDLLYADQLERVGALIDAYGRVEKPLFSVGSSGIEMALGAAWAARRTLTPAKKWVGPGKADPLLVVSGSCSPVTEQQIIWAVQNGFVAVSLDTVDIARSRDLSGAVKRATAEAVEHLAHGRSVIVNTSLGDSDPRIQLTADVFAQAGLSRAEEKGLTAKLFGSALGRVVHDVLEQVRLKRVVIAGGDTSSYAARALELEAVEIIAPLVPGAPLCRARAPGAVADGLEINFKGGQVGSEDYFGLLAAGK